MNSPVFSLKRKLIFSLLLFSLFHPGSTSLHAQAGGYLINSNFESPQKTYNPWGGVNSTTGEITLPGGDQVAVDDNGNIKNANFSPGLAVGDLNGDGLPDLLMADTRGYIWFFPNSGTKNAPKFTFGEVLPLWPGSELAKSIAHSRAIVPRIQLADLDGDGKLDLLVGTFEGALYYFHNDGTTRQPVFSMPQQLDNIALPTSTDGQLWCNYLSPFWTIWPPNRLGYLLMGDGSYSANSIYMFKNLGDATRPKLSDQAKWKIIPGMGREHLTPQVVDWNGDGKPDIICGERTGFLDLFLNTSTSDDGPPTFDDGSHVKLGRKDNFGPFALPCVADLNGSGLPSLLVSNAQGKVSYAQNTGTPGQTKFSDPVPLQGKNPYPDILVPIGWSLNTPFGDSYNLLVVTNADVEPGFKPPEGHQGKNAIKAYVFPSTNTYFTTRYFVPPNSETDSLVHPNEHAVQYDTGVRLQEGKSYEVSFYVMTDGDVSDTRVKLGGVEFDKGGVHTDFDVIRPFSASNTWSKVTDTLSWRSHYGEKNDYSGFGFSFRWHGEGAIYLDDITLRPEE